LDHCVNPAMSPCVSRKLGLMSQTSQFVESSCGGVCKYKRPP
jgi:hypothetical protein